MSSVRSYFVPLVTTSPFEQQRLVLDAKLVSFSELRTGWSFGEGRAVQEDSIALARVLVLLAADFRLKADVFPNLDGGCAVAYYEGPDKVEVNVNADGSTDLTYERGIGSDFEDVIPPQVNVSRNAIIAALLRLQNPTNLWMLSASSISGTSTSPSSVSVTGSSRTPQIPAVKTLLTGVGGSQSSRQLVPVPAI